MTWQRRPTRTAVILWTCVIFGFAVMEFPGVLFFHDVAEPRIFGMPFIYGFTIIVWALMCVVLFIGYRTHWGRRRADVDDAAPESGADGGEHA
ncbi:hypothetical protein [Nesterenkonia sp. PF2B19]|uniref:hypothetical protein n=1 Tax=Nesterenkonia sp. PF2B19 TaxID=1881858 RepID=UPI00087330F6|nr:hypothetical protein [Nesterenkonia sp. PF2B19]